MNAFDADRLASTRAVYDHSADQFVATVGTAVSPRFEAPLDRALLAAFVEEVSSHEDGPVLDVGCGPGRIAGHLAAHGLDVGGVDISSRMIEAARAAYPDLRFDQGSLTALPVQNSSQAAAVYWYSIIATPPAGLAAAWRELDRVLRSDGRALLAFQAGQGEAITTSDAHGSSHTLTLYRHAVEHVTDTLHDAGYEVRAHAIREPQLMHETAPQAFLFCGRTEGDDGRRSANPRPPQ